MTLHRALSPAEATVNAASLVPTPPDVRIVPHPELSAASPEATSTFDVLDHAAHAAIARLTAGLSPAALALAFFDWSVHLAASPGKQLSLASEIIEDASRFAEVASHFSPTFRPWSVIKPSRQDRRFSDRDWELPAFNMLAQAFLFQEKWCQSAATNVRGVARANAAIADFTMRQCLDVVAPSNVALLNPEVLRSIMESGGGNFVSGLHNWLEDVRTLIGGGPTGPAANFLVGKDVAITRGKVVYRNELIELINTRRLRPWSGPSRC